MKYFLGFMMAFQQGGSVGYDSYQEPDPVDMQHIFIPSGRPRR